jgi:hypothetical protein
LDEIDEPSSTFNNLGSMTNRLSFLFILLRIEEFSTKLTYLLYTLLRYTNPSVPLSSLGKDKVLNMSKANDLKDIANSCSWLEFSVIFIYNFILDKMVITIDMEQVITEMLSWFMNGSLPTLNEPLKTLNMIVGISK